MPALPASARSRANSDVAVANISQNVPPPRRNPAAKKVVPPVAAAKGAGLDIILKDPPPEDDVPDLLREMRYLIMTDGVDSNGDGMVCTF